MTPPPRSERSKARTSRPAAALTLAADPLGGLAVPPRGSPFIGISGTKASAHNLDVPHLTAHVALARAQRERLTHGGLLTPQQRAAEQKAARTLAAKTPESPPAHTKSRAPATKKTAALPLPSRTPSAPFTPPARKPTSQPTLPPGLLKPSTAPFTVPLPSASASMTPLRTGPRRAQPAYGARGGAPIIRSSHRSATAVSWALSGPLLGHAGAAKVAHAIDLGAGTALAAAGPSLLSAVARGGQGRPTPSKSVLAATLRRSLATS